jgi:hypothetical protein
MRSDLPPRQVGGVLAAPGGPLAAWPGLSGVGFSPQARPSGLRKSSKRLNASTVLCLSLHGLSLFHPRTWQPPRLVLQSRACPVPRRACPS